MYICNMCKEPIAAGTQYVNAFDKNICLDCAVRNTLDDVMAVFGITYTEAPDEIVAECVLVYDNTDSVTTPEQVEDSFRSENPTFSPTQVGEKMEKNAEYGMTALNPHAFIPKHEEVDKDLVTMTRDEFVEKYQYANTGDGDEDTISNLLGKEVAGRYYDDWHKEVADKNPTLSPTQVGEKNAVLVTLSARGVEDFYKKAWVYESARDAKYWAEHYLKNMPNLLSIDGFVSEGEIPDGYIVYRVDDDDTEEMTDEEGEPVFKRVFEYKNTREHSWTTEDIEKWRKEEAEMTAYIRQCDTMEQFLEKYPDMEEYWEAEVEGK